VVEVFLVVLVLLELLVVREALEDRLVQRGQQDLLLLKLQVALVAQAVEVVALVDSKWGGT